jgi:hypothetical protein
MYIELPCRAIHGIYGGSNCLRGRLPAHCADDNGWLEPQERRGHHLHAAAVRVAKNRSLIWNAHCIMFVPLRRGLTFGEIERKVGNVCSYMVVVVTETEKRVKRQQREFN